jgi:hypothetical protein
MKKNFDPVGIAIVGCGNISDQYLANSSAFRTSVLACADLDLNRASAQASKYGVPRSGDLAAVLAMPDVELVVNLTIPAVHARVSMQAIQAGKHVYGEKPFALSVREARTLIAAAKSGVQLGAPPTFLGAGLQTGPPADRRRPHRHAKLSQALLGYPGPDAWHPSPEFLFQEEEAAA